MIQAYTIKQIEAEAERMRSLLKKEPDNSLYNAQLATALQQLDYLSPDGGSRIPEAERVYR
jgi:hypothetical protein